MNLLLICVTDPSCNLLQNFSIVAVCVVKARGVDKVDIGANIGFAGIGDNVLCV